MALTIWHRIMDLSRCWRFSVAAFCLALGLTTVSFGLPHLLRTRSMAMVF